LPFAFGLSPFSFRLSPLAFRLAPALSASEGVPNAERLDALDDVALQVGLALPGPQGPPSGFLDPPALLDRRNRLFGILL
jgi:hypothetical protein